MFLVDPGVRVADTNVDASESHFHRGSIPVMHDLVFLFMLHSRLFFASPCLPSADTHSIMFSLFPVSQRRDPGKPNENPGDDSDPMSEDDDSDDGDNLDDDDEGGSAPSSKVVGVPLAAAQAAAGDSAAKTGAQAHKFMPPIEVELQMQQLWKQESSTLDLIFVSGRRTGSGSAVANGAPSNTNGDSGGGVSDGYRLFFVRALAVPPPRFRPPMNMGDMIAEHPQNVYLTKVRLSAIKHVFM